MKNVKKILTVLILSSGLVIVVFFGLQCGGRGESPAPDSSIIDIHVKGEKYFPFWKTCIGAGRAQEALRAGWLEQLQVVKDNCGFSYCRFHGIFHDDMFVYSEKDGKSVYNWQYIDDVFDRMLAIGVKPFVELGFFPKQIAAENSKMQFWWNANITPDINRYDKWYALVKNFTQHCVDRYGLDEVSKWYFEVWNEPNLDRAFFDGTRTDYLQLYKISALAVKSVNENLRVGGPSTSNFVPDKRFYGERENRHEEVERTYATSYIDTLKWKGVWIDEFLAFCQKEKLPVDFISCHPYPTDYALVSDDKGWKGLTRYVHATRDDMVWLKLRMMDSPYPDAEIHYTEWASNPNSRNENHDCLHEAAYILKVNLDCIGLCNSLAYRSFTDIMEEKGAGETIFHGGFGLINYQGIVKPSFHAYRMLNALGDEMIYRKDGMVITRRPDKKIVALLYNYPKDIDPKILINGHIEEDDIVYEMSPQREVDFTLKGFKSGTLFNVEILDRDHGNALKVWTDMGSPEPPDRMQTEKLKRMALQTYNKKIEADSKGTLVWKRQMQPWQCILITQL